MAEILCPAGALIGTHRIGNIELHSINIKLYLTY